jgi:hypothetical protein
MKKHKGIFMTKQLALFLIFCSIFCLEGHIRFINTTNQNLLIVDVQLKKSYKVDVNQQTMLITTARASHFLIYVDAEQQTSEHQKDETPLFSFGTTDHMQIHLTPTISPENLLQSDLPEHIFIIPSAIKRTQAINLITKPITHCSKCAERKKAQAEKAQAQVTH